LHFIEEKTTYKRKGGGFMANKSSFAVENMIGKYVYYDGLKITHPALYSAARHRTQAITNALESKDTSSKVVSNLLTLARSEAEKERALLVSVFGYEASSFDLNSPSAYADILKGINAAMNMKGAIERTIYRMNNLKKKNGEDSNSAITPDNFFANYFLTAWDSESQKLEEKIDALAEATIPVVGEAIPDSFKATVEEYMDEAIKNAMNEALTKMINSKVMNKKDSNMTEEEKELKGIYKDLQNNLGRIRETGTLADALYKKYNIDQFLNNMLKGIQRTRKISRARDKVGSKKDLEKLIPRGSALSRVRGEAHEDFMKAIIEQVTSGIKGGFKGGVGSVLSSGATKMKADLMISYGLDTSRLNDIINMSKKDLNKKDGSQIRELSVEKGKNIADELAKINDGFVVMMSAKDYGKTTISKMGGFHGGTYSLNNIGALEEYVPNMENVVFAVMNAGTGAVGANLDGVANTIAGAIGHLLFDDVATIGNVQKGSGRAIHMFSLDGVFVPLSFFLSQVATSMMELATSQMVKVRIKTTSTHYSQLAPSTIEQWNDERDSTLAQSKITVIFFRKFLKVLNELG
jgi:hypothetical protein